MPALLVDCHGGYYDEKEHLVSMLSLDLPTMMETETARAFRM